MHVLLFTFSLSRANKQASTQVTRDKTGENAMRFIFGRTPPLRRVYCPQQAIPGVYSSVVFFVRSIDRSSWNKVVCDCDAVALARSRLYNGRGTTTYTYLSMDTGLFVYCTFVKWLYRGPVLTVYYK